jgi:hypothetical protein
MDLNRLRALIAALLVSLFLILVLCTIGVRRPASVGILVPVTKIRTISNYNCDVLAERLLSSFTKTAGPSTPLRCSQDDKSIEISRGIAAIGQTNFYFTAGAAT